MTTVAIIYGGPSREHEVSVNTASAILRNIKRDSRKILLVYLDRTNKGCILPDALTATIPDKQELHSYNQVFKELATSADFALLAVHGEFGEDGALQKILEVHAIPYSGSGPISSALCMDKDATMKKLENLEDINIPAYKKGALQNLRAIVQQERNYPYVLKPNALGSSVGVAIIRNFTDMEQAVIKFGQEFSEQEFLLQQCIEPALELTCGCLQQKNGEIIKLPPIEIIPNGSAFFDYTAKYTQDGSQEICPPVHLSQAFCDQLSTLAVTIHQQLECQTYSRSDFLYKDSRLFYLETNTLPGMTDASLIPKEAKTAGITFPELLDFLIENGGINKV